MEPETVAELGVTAVPLTTTENAPGAAVVADNASPNVNVTEVPSAFVEAETNEGDTLSALFVTEVAESDAASFPAASCTAFASLLPEGSVYATLTDSPVVTTEANVSSTVEPDTETLDTPRDEPPTSTANALASAVVVDNASEYVKITFVPAEFTTAELKVGAVESAAVTVKVNVCVAVPVAFVAVIVYAVADCTVVGVPVNNPVDVLNVKPAGADGLIA